MVLNQVSITCPQTAANAIESIAMKKKQSRNKSKHPTVEPWVYLRHDLDNLGQFEKIMSLDGEIFREAPGRKTVRFKQNKRNYFFEDAHRSGMAGDSQKSFLFAFTRARRNE